MNTAGTSVIPELPVMRVGKSAIRNPKWAAPYFVDADEPAAQRCCQ